MNSLLELENDYRELRDRESKDAEIKIRKEIDKPFFKSVTVYIDDMNKSEEKKFLKRRPLDKNTWYNWLINYILETIKRSDG